MIWIVAQNEVSIVSMEKLIDIFIKQKMNKYRIFARIAPETVSKDSSTTSVIELGAYGSMDEAQVIFGQLIEFIGEYDGYATLFKMPPQEGEL